MNDAPIKTMKLYSRVERVFNELEAAGIGEQDSIPLDLLSRFDQYHYFGTEAVDDAIEAMGLGETDHVLDIGAGIGGPARYLAERAGCRITAVELQSDLHETAQILTERCGLHHRIRHLRGDFLDSVVPEGQFDAAVSWLVFLHIPERAQLYRSCFEALRPGGQLWVEDFFERTQFTDRDRRDLADKLYCHFLPGLEAFADGLARVGFEAVELTDHSEPWGDFVAERAAAYRASREHQIALHGREVFEGLDDFYATVERLFAGGRFGGVRVTARRPD